jgi:hypothetical protein
MHELPDRNWKDMPAFLAFEKILSVIPRNRRKDASRFSFDPTTGALIISPELDRKICKALSRAARRIAFRLKVRSELFRFQLFAAQMRCLVLKASGDLYGYLANLAVNRHSRFPPT